MTNEVTLHIGGGRATFGAAGIQLTPWFTSDQVQIPWTNVMFVSPVPAVKRIGDEWHTLRGERIVPAALRYSLRFYCLDVALNDRGQLLASASLLTRMWLLLTVWLKPLYLADDKPHPTNGRLRLSLRKRWLRKNASSLLSALDIIERFSKFDLLADID